MPKRHKPTTITGTSPVAVNGTSTLTVSVASSVPPGAYSVTVNGMSGSQAGQNNHSITIPVTVTGGGGTPDFTLSANPASVTVAAPGSGTTTIMVNPVNGFTGSVALSVAGLPSGVTAAFNPQSTTGTSVLTFTASSTAVAGTYPVTVTGVSGSLSHTVAVSVTITGLGVIQASDYLAAYATSSSTIRVYWQPVIGATSYKLFRSTVSGQYNQSTPISVIPGNANRTARAYYADDTNLTAGVEYFYVVMSVQGSTNSPLSEEDSAIPSVDAIPWSGTPSQILSKAQEIADQQVVDPVTGETLPYKLLVMGPDATLYDGDTQTALPPNTVDESTGTFNIQGITIPMPSSLTDDGIFTTYLHPYQPLSSLILSAHSYYHRQGTDPGYAGAFRRALSVPSTQQINLTGVQGTFAVPPDQFPLPGIQVADQRTSIGLYLGIHDTYTTLPNSSRGVEIDSGTAYHAADVLNPTYPNRWSLLQRISDGSRKDRTNDHSGLNHRVNSSQKFFVKTSDMPLGGRINEEFTIDRLNKRCFSSQSFVIRGGASIASFIFVEIGAVKRIYSLSDVKSVGMTQQFKRQASIDEGKRSTYIKVPYVGDDIIGAASRYFQENSRINNGYWQDGQLQVSGSWQQWTNTLLDESHRPGKRPDGDIWQKKTVSLNPVNGDATAETFTIDVSYP